MAAGRGLRMKSKTAKPFHHLGGEYLVSHVINSMQKSGIEEIIIIEPFFIAIGIILFPSKLFPFIAKKILSFLISFELNEIPEKKIFFLLLSILVK